MVERAGTLCLFGPTFVCVCVCVCRGGGGGGACVRACVRSCVCARFVMS